MDGILLPVLMTATLTVFVSCHQVCFIGSEYNPQSGIPPRWFLPYKDPCNCTAIRLGGMRIPASSYRQGAPYYLDHLILSEDPKEIQAVFNCPVSAGGCVTSEPLGLEDGTIPDDRIRASSIFSEEYLAAYARLNNHGSSWAAKSSQNSWIEVDLHDPTVVSGVITQGSTYSHRCVTKYRVRYQSSHSSGYKYVKDEDGFTKVFDGNKRNNPRAPVTNHFSHRLMATKVRIEPLAWVENVVLRLELLGCRLN
ncbi:retinoschisin-like [Patiria miniata]|uniref:F5/8 type C domain-containing protein n=1 Tax=Patiria miniata TaxID=46514 RepID=A0A913Z6K3_PATMI|nr:retinoschisin-like [Patiria miniata]